MPRWLSEGGDDFVQVVVADPLLEHLLKKGNHQAHVLDSAFCSVSTTAELFFLFFITLAATFGCPKFNSTLCKRGVSQLPLQQVI